MARVLVPSSNYAAAFATPRRPQRHQLSVGEPVAHLRRLWRPLDGLAVWDPRERWQVMHSFNKVPVTRGPFLVTFESALPRTYGRAGSLARDVLRRRLLRENCRAVIALSEYAVRRTRALHAEWEHLPLLEAKMQVIHPNLPLVRQHPKRWAGGEVRLLFVGRHWARKGGVVAVRLAREARRRGLPVHLTVVSTLAHGGSVYADHPDRRRYAPDLELLGAPNVTHVDRLPNAEVLRLMDESTFTLLPTVHDTYGFSVLEGFSTGTPALVSRTGALPEVVHDGVSGHLLDVPLDRSGDWPHLHARSWEALDALYTSMAEQAADRVEAFLDDPAGYEGLSAGAIARVREHHDAEAVGARLEDLYERAAAPA